MFESLQHNSGALSEVKFLKDKEKVTRALILFKLIVVGIYTFLMESKMKFNLKGMFSFLTQETKGVLFGLTQICIK